MRVSEEERLRERLRRDEEIKGMRKDFNESHNIKFKKEVEK